MNANASAKDNKNTRSVIGLITMLMVMSSFFVLAQSKKDNFEAMEVEADTLVSQQTYDDAIALYDNIIAKKKRTTNEDYRIYYKRAFAQYSGQHFEQALSDVNAYLEKNDDSQAKLLRLYINQELGNSDDQLKDLDEFIRQSPGNADLIRWRASVLMESGKYKEAQQDIRYLLTQGSSPELEAYLGLCYYYSDNADSALLIFDKVIAAKPDYTQVYLFAGSLCLEQEVYDLALKYINTGLKYESDNTTLIFYKGIALVELSRLEEGCRCLTKAFDAGFDDAGDYLKDYCYSAE